MPTNTYVALRTETVATATPSVTFSLSGISGYTDLVISSSVQNTTSASTIAARYNGDTGANYSFTYILGDGTTAISGRSANQTFAVHGYANTTQFATSTTHINNYSNSTTYKTTLDRRGTVAQFVGSTVSTWRNTAAITSITIYNENGSNFAVGSTFSLYGIGGIGGDSTVKALGGVVTEDATHYYHTFKGAGTFEPLQSLSADILVVAGGGGGATGGGGAGAGGLLGFASQSLTAQRYPVLVGAGGSGAATTPVLPTNGNDSKFGTLTTALGGGRASGYNGGADYFSSVVGGSGGGGAFNASGQLANGTAGQGNAGNNGYQAAGGGDPRSGGGGGGAGGAATNGGVANTGANGGVGATNGSTVGGSAGPYSFINAMGAASGTGQLSGGNYYYAGGGGGHGKVTGGSGGVGGGGNGSGGSAESVAGTQYTGGGAGSGGPAYDGPRGGSGIVIVRYAKA